MLVVVDQVVHGVKGLLQQGVLVVLVEARTGAGAVGGDGPAHNCLAGRCELVVVGTHGLIR